ncbi:MAG: carbonic anhydrase [Deltaproteobacteria bacterium]
MSHIMSEVSAEEALQKLKEGNKRFVSGNYAEKNIGPERRKDLYENGQKPFAIIVTCSDSRVAPEHIFDQGLGDLFVVRVAGNVINDFVMGSVEYAAEHLGVQLVVILGHEKCGAVKAAVEGGEAPGFIGSIVNKIVKSVQKAMDDDECADGLCEAATNHNIKEAVEEAKESDLIDHLVEEGVLHVVGAKYNLCSGEVIWF